MNVINVPLTCTHITQRKRAIVLVAIQTPGTTMYCQRCRAQRQVAPNSELREALRRRDPCD